MSTRFFKNFSDVPKEIVEFGLKTIAPDISLDSLKKILSNERQVYRYKEEIRKHFCFRAFSIQDKFDIIKTFQDLFSINLMTSSLKEMICNI